MKKTESVWTHDVPTMPGFYWWRHRGDNPVVLMVRFRNESYGLESIPVCGGNWHSVGKRDATIEWCGPINEPSEPDKRISAIEQVLSRQTGWQRESCRRVACEIAWAIDKNDNRLGQAP